MFIETKVWISDYGYEQTLRAFDKSARKLGVDQIGLLLLHQPVPRSSTTDSVRSELNWPIRVLLPGDMPDRLRLRFLACRS